MALNFAQQSPNPTGLEIIPHPIFYQSIQETEANEITPRQNDIIAAVPISIKKPELMQADGSGRKRKRGTSSELKGIMKTNFCLVDLYKTNNIQEINLERENGEITLDPRKLLKNLKGWKIEVREHQDKKGGSKTDKRYYHPKSKRILKSLAEVKKFIIENSYVREASIDDESSKYNRILFWARKGRLLYNGSLYIKVREGSPIILTGLEIIPHPAFNQAKEANEIIAAEQIFSSNPEQAGDGSKKRGRGCTTSISMGIMPKDFCLLELYNSNNIQEINKEREINGKVTLDPQELHNHLKGWTIDRRKREGNNGKPRIDKFYFHPKSKRTLRSLAEVKTWIEVNSYVRNA